MWDAGRGRAYKIMPEAIKSLGKTALLGSTQVRQSEVAIFPIFDVINLGAGPRCRFSFFGGPGFLLFFFQFGYSASRHYAPPRFVILGISVFVIWFIWIASMSKFSSLTHYLFDVLQVT